MNCVLAIEKIASDLKAMRLAGQITNDELKTWVDRIKPLYERAKFLESEKAYRNERAKYTTRKLKHYRHTSKKKSFVYLYWEPGNPNSVSCVQIKSDQMTIHKHSLRDAIKWIKDRRDCLFFNAVKFWEIFGEGDLPSCVVDYKSFLCRYTIGGRTPNDVFRRMSIPHSMMSRYLEQAGVRSVEEVPPPKMMVITALWHRRS